MHPFIENSIQVTKLLQLEWDLSVDDSIVVKSLLVYKNKDELKWEDAKKWTDEVALKSYLKKKNWPISIIFSGKGILYKSLELETKNLKDIVARMIPSGLESDYFVSALVDNNKVYSSLIRREKIVSILDSLQAFSIINTFIGDHSVLVLPRLFDVQLPITLTKLTLFADKEGKLDFDYSQTANSTFTLDTNNEKIESDFSPCLCNAAQFFYHFIPDINSCQDEVIAMQKDYRYKVIMDKVLKPMLALLFLVFLANFLYLSRLETQYLTLFTHYELNKEQSELVNKLELEIRNREELLQRSGWSSTHATAFLSDRIAATVPKEISLDQLNIQPLKQSIRDGNQVGFEWKRIHIEGEVNNSSSLNSWIQNLDTISFIDEVLMSDYQIDRSRKWAQFKLDLSIK
jgi:hypothetical protein